MKIFLTGGSGFIGSHFCHKLLGQGDEVLALSRKKHPAQPGLTWLLGDLADPESYRKALTRFAPDAIVHLAWEGLPDYSEKQGKKNLEQSIELFKSGADTGCRTLLVTGSCWEYARNEGAVLETDAIDDTKSFARAKNELRVLGMRLAQKKNIQFVWARLFFVYGPGQKSGSLIPSVIKNLESGSKVEIRRPNDRQDFLFVTDAAEALYALLKLAPAGAGAYNVGSGIPTRVSDVAAIVAEEMGITDFLLEAADKAQSDSGFWADMTKMRAIGWRPGLGIKEGIRMTVRNRLKKQGDLSK